MKILFLIVKRGLGNKFYYFIGILAVATFIIYLTTPVEDELVEFVNDFPYSFDPWQNAPQAALTEASKIAPNYFTTCEFQNKIYYFDESGARRLIGAESYNPVPFKKLSIVTEQTNRKVINLFGEVWASCKTKSTFESLVPTIDSGTVLVQATITDSTGRTIMAYSKSTSIGGTTGSGHNVQGKDLTKNLKLLEFEIPAKDIESKLTKSSTSYKSLIKIKPNTQLEIYFKGDGNKNTWTVGGQTTTSLRVLVNNDQFTCTGHCKVGSKEIKVNLIRPSDGIAEINDRRVTFTVTLPQWSSSEGSPSFLIKDENGLSAISETKLSLIKTDVGSGIFTKSVLLPNREGEFELVVRSEQRNTSTTPIQVVKVQTGSDDGGNGSDKGGDGNDNEQEGCKEGEITREVAGIIFCLNNPLMVLLLDNWFSVLVGIVIFLIVIGIIAKLIRRQ